MLGQVIEESLCRVGQGQSHNITMSRGHVVRVGMGTPVVDPGFSKGGGIK